MVVVACLVVAGLALRRAPQQPARPVTLTVGAWAPYVGPNLPDGGPVAQLVAEVLQRQGLRPEVEFSSWSLAADRVERGEAFGTFPYIASASRQEAFLLSDPLLEFDYRLWHATATGPPPIERPADLGNLRIALPDGYEAWEALDDAVAEFVPAPTVAAAFAMLREGDVDLVVEGRLPGEVLIRDELGEADPGDFAVLDPGGSPWLGARSSLHLMLPRTAEARDVMARFNEDLADARDSTLYTEVLAAVRGVADHFVHLTAAGDEGPIPLHTGPEAAERVLLPAGTTAEVLEWPEAYLEPSLDDDGARIRVKVLNGPSRGRVGWVAAAHVRLQETP